jgi:GTPase SAR1 family protein
MLEKFSCVKDGGLEVYSKDFVKSSNKIDSQLISGFFYALQSISEEMNNPVSFIRLQNSLVYIKSYGEFLIILMFSSLPNETALNKSFDELAKLIIEYFDDLDTMGDPLPIVFVNKVMNILSIFTFENILSRDEDSDTIKKIVILGLARVGKTSIKKKFFNQYSEKNLQLITPTIGIDISKNRIDYLNESILVMDFGGQDLYRAKYLKEEKNWINISTIIYVIDVQDQSGFEDSLNYLNEIFTNIKKITSQKPLLAIFINKFDPSLQKSLKTNVQELLVIFKDYIKESLFFFTSIEDISCTNAIIKVLFLSLPSLVLKLILQSFLIEMFQETILLKLKELDLSTKVSKQLFSTGEGMGVEISNDFQSKWLQYYMGNFKAMEQNLNTKKVHINLNGSSMRIEINNWEDEGVPLSLTNQFLTGFLTGVFKTLYISSTVICEENKISTVWKVDLKNTT